jgi:hypothetical protein
MKRALALLGAATFVTTSIFAGPEAVLKRARETRDQNNVRQGVPLPAQPSQPSRRTAPAASTAPNPLLQQNLVKVRSNLAAIRANSTVTAAQKQQLSTNLLACAQGASKPSPATVATLAESLTAAFVEKPLSQASRNRLVSDLAVVLNPAKYSAGQIQAVCNDVQAIFQANGTARRDAVKIADQVKAVAAETQR